MLGLLGAPPYRTPAEQDTEREWLLHYVVRFGRDMLASLPWRILLAPKCSLRDVFD
nr:hypothetical protein [uncultured Lichenicoccus sp.]